MKKLIMFVLIISMLVTVFASCSPNDETGGANSSENSAISETETSPSDMSETSLDSETSTIDESDATSKSEYVFVPHEEYVPDRDVLYKTQHDDISNKYFDGFFDWPTSLFYGEDEVVKFQDVFNITDESIKKFYALYGRTISDSYGFFLEYFQISKEEYIEFINEVVNEANVETVDKRYPLLRYVNGWYGENYLEDENMILSDYESKGENYYAEKRDGKHNSIYYTIDYRLINYVGKDKFEEYLSKTDDVNILSFIKYFDIDAYTFSGIIYKNAWGILPYKTYYVYADEDLREAYFGFATNETPVDTTLFYPSAHPYDDLFSGGDGIHDPRYFVITDELLSKALGKKVENTNNFYQSNEFTRLYYTTEEWNYGFLIEYFGITEKQWREWVDELYPVEDRGYKNLEWQYDLWFRNKYQESLLTLSILGEFPEVRTYYGERIDKSYNSIYYKIDRKLILKVGVDKFENFLKKYEGTKDCNIMKFIKEFNLTEKDFENLYSPYLPENRGKSVPYNLEAMFDEPDAYFKTAK